MKQIILSTLIILFISTGFAQEANKKKSVFYFGLGTSAINYNFKQGSFKRNTPSLGLSSELGANINNNWSAGIQARVGFNVGWSSGFILGHPTLDLYSSAGIHLERNLGKRWSIQGIANVNIFRASDHFFTAGLGPRVVLGAKEKLALKLTLEANRSKIYNINGGEIIRIKSVLDIGAIYYL